MLLIIEFIGQAIKILWSTSYQWHGLNWLQKSGWFAKLWRFIRRTVRAITLRVIILWLLLVALLLLSYPLQMLQAKILLLLANGRALRLNFLDHWLLLPSLHRPSRPYHRLLLSSLRLPLIIFKQFSLGLRLIILLIIPTDDWIRNFITFTKNSRLFLRILYQNWQLLFDWLGQLRLGWLSI